jgi:hypothetical protein
MRISKIASTFVATLALASPTIAALTADQIVGGISDLTTKVKALTAISLELTRSNAPLVQSGKGPFEVSCQQ